MPADASGVRTLILLRHAKAEKSGPSDHDRALAESGRRDASVIGAAMREATLRPELAVVSTSLRTRQTWQLVAAELESPPREQLERAIFDNEVETLLDLVRAVPDDVRTLLLVGHNPSVEELAAYLDDGTGDARARQRIRGGFPTSAFAVFATPESWGELGRAGLSVQAFAAPKDFG